MVSIMKCVEHRKTNHGYTYPTQIRKTSSPPTKCENPVPEENATLDKMSQAAENSAPFLLSR